MNVLGIVPARGGSKRIERKNLRTLAGRTLVDWAIDAGLEARSLSRVVVSSEDPEILERVRARDPSLAIERPREYASDTSPVVHCVGHALEVLEAEAPDACFDAVAVLHPTSPLRLPRDIDRTVALLESSGASSAVSVVRVNHMVHPLKLKTLEADRLLPYLEEEKGRRMAHQLPDVYVRNGAVYAARRSLVDAGELIGEDCRGYVMPSERSVDINEEIDFKLAEMIFDEGSRF